MHFSKKKKVCKKEVHVKGSFWRTFFLNRFFESLCSLKRKDCVQKDSFQKMSLKKISLFQKEGKNNFVLGDLEGKTS